MNKNIVAKISDIAFRYVIVFFISFAWLRFYIYNVWTCALLSIATTIIVNTIINAIVSKKNNKKLISINEQRNIENCAEQLKYMNNIDRMKLFTSLIKDAKNIKITKNYAYFYKNNKKTMIFYTNNNKIEYIYDILSQYKNSCNKIIIISNEWKIDEIKLANNINFDLILLDKELVYKHLYKPNNIYPASQIEMKPAKKTGFKDFVLTCVQRKNFSRFLFAGFVIMFASLIMPYNIYYIVWGSMLLTLSFICLLSPLWTKNVSKDIFD